MYVILLIKNIFVKKIILITSIILTISLMLNIDYAVSLILDIGDILYDATSNNLISRKEGSATARLLSFSQAVNGFISNPFGGSSHTGIGLILTISLVGGVFLFLASWVFLLNIIKYSLNKFSNSNQKSIKFGVSFVISTLIIAAFLSGYGWDRVPGVIMMILFYRHLKEGGCGRVNKVFNTPKPLTTF